MDSGDTFALRTNNAGNGNLLNPAGLDDGGPAERYVSMSITRNPAGASLRTEKRYTEELRNPLDTRDIPGTRANLRFNHVRDTFHETGDISGAAPKPRHLSRSGHIDILELDDIPGTRARKTDLQTRRCTNPLDPAYKLPSAAEVVPAPAPFKRELQLRLDDIEGTKPATYLPWKPRERTMDVTDIEGTRSVPLVREATGHPDALAVRDITDAGRYRSQRGTDPLQPRYVVNGMVVRDDDDSRARSPAKARDGSGDMFSLRTSDIDGAAPATWGSIKTGVIRLDQRKDFAETNKIDDLPGAHAGTLAKGIRSMRNAEPTDPNERNYRLLDGRGMDADDLLVGRGWYTAAAAAVAGESAGRLPASSTMRPASEPAAAVGGAGSATSSSFGASTSGSGSGMPGLRAVPSSPLRASTADRAYLAAAEAANRGPALSKLQWVQEKSRALQLGSTGSAGAAGAAVPYPQERPAVRVAKSLLDPRDAEIARLRGALEATRAGRGTVGGSAGALLGSTASTASLGATSARDSDAAREPEPPSAAAATGGGVGIADVGAGTGGLPADLAIAARATARARAAAKKKQQASLVETKPPRAAPPPGELTFSQLLASMIVSGPTAAGRRASGPGFAATGGSGSLRLSGMSASGAASLRHDAMEVRRVTRDRESDLSAVRSLPS